MDHVDIETRLVCGDLDLVFHRSFCPFSHGS